MTMKHALNMISNSVALRQAVAKWKHELPKADQIAIKALNETRQQAAENLERQADRWMSENRLIHAGAALKLAKELREKLQ